MGLPRAKLILITIIMMVISLSSTFCSSIKLPEIEVKAISAYLLSQEKEGLKIAIDPVFDKAKMKRLFNLDLSSEGILPVLVIAENHNPQFRYFLDKAAFLIKSSDSESTEKVENPNPSQPQAKMAAASAAVMGTSAAIVTIGAIPAFLLYPIIGKMHTDAQISMQNLKEKELLEKTLSFGDSQHGFVYFKFHNNRIFGDHFEIHIKAVNLERGEPLTFVFSVARAIEIHHEK